MVLAALLSAGPASGQKALVASLLYEGPSLVAPAVLFLSSGADGRAWRVGLTGWTVAGEWSRRTSPDRTVLASAGLTPLNANGSDRVFRDGVRLPELAWQNGTATAALGIRLHPSPEWLSEIRLVGQYERVTGLSEPTLERWRRPFAGLELAQTYQRVAAEDPLRSHLEGLRIQGRLQAFAGASPWGRLLVSMDAGRAMGPVLLRGRVSYMRGHALDTVSAFLVGGSWDAPGVHSLYGHPYAAFRVHHGALLRGGLDAPLGGGWRLGLRAGYLASPAAVRSGGMVRIGTSLAGVGAYAGVAAPGTAIRDRSLERTLLIAGVSAAFLPR